MWDESCLNKLADLGGRDLACRLSVIVLQLVNAEERIIETISIIPPNCLELVKVEESSAI